MKKLKFILISITLFSVFAYGQEDSIKSDKNLPIEEIFQVVDDDFKFPDISPCDEILDTKLKNDCFMDELQKAVYKNLEYPQVAIDNKIEGTVVLTFSFDHDKKQYLARVLRDIGAKTGSEALRSAKVALQELLPHYSQQPYRHKTRGNPVRVSLNMPIKFRLPK